MYFIPSIELALAYIPLLFCIAIIIYMSSYEVYLSNKVHGLLVVSCFMLLALTVLLMFGLVI